MKIYFSQFPVENAIYFHLMPEMLGIMKRPSVKPIYRYGGLSDLYHLSFKEILLDLRLQNKK